MKSALRKKVIEEKFFLSDPSTYLTCMARNYTFIDNLFLKFFAVLTNRDIIILPLHPEAALGNKEFTWTFGNFF